VNERRAAVGREEWAKRVERWKDSGLTAKEFAAELGINAGSLQQWAHQLKKGAVRAKRETAPHKSAPRFVEVTPAVAVPQGFDIRIGRFTIAVPGGFDEGNLLRLLETLKVVQ
jgi:transposase